MKASFAAEDLFIEDNYDFLPILGGREWLVLSPAYTPQRSSIDK